MTSPHPLIRTHHARHGRITPLMRRTLSEVGPRFRPDWQRIDRPVVLEIGCGNGAAALAYADAHPDAHVVAIDVHTPGVAQLLLALDACPRPNVSTTVVDALDLLAADVPAASLGGVHLFFPDPWPKRGHHKRRFVRPDVLDLVAGRLRPGGHVLASTDDANYAQAMVRAFDEHPAFDGGVTDRPTWRPVTTYERKASLAGRAVVELGYRRRAAGRSD